MLVLNIIWDVCFIVLALLLIILWITGDLEATWGLVCLGLAGWAVWDLRKRLREMRKRKEISDLEEEREEIRQRMEKKAE